MSQKLLEVTNLSMHYDTLDGNVEAVKNVSFTVNSGESFGLVGESGCGKTSVAMTLLQLQPDNSVITEGSIKIDGQELMMMGTPDEYDHITWRLELLGVADSQEQDRVGVLINELATS